MTHFWERPTKPHFRAPHEGSRKITGTRFIRKNVWADDRPGEPEAKHDQSKNLLTPDFTGVHNIGMPSWVVHRSLQELCRSCVGRKQGSGQMVPGNSLLCSCRTDCSIFTRRQPSFERTNAAPRRTRPLAISNITD